MNGYLSDRLLANLPLDPATFVGRDAELSRVREWLVDPRASTHILFISGIGGIGKTTLLQRIAQIALEAGVRTEWIDGRAPDYGLSTGIVAPADPFVERVPNRTVWCIDNCDSLQSIGGWIRRKLVDTPERHRSLFVMASRAEPPLSWKSDPVWRGRWALLTLEPLSPAESRRLLSQAGVDRLPGADALLRSARGYPLVLALGIDALVRSVPAWPQDGWETPRQISAHLLREVTTPEMQPFLDVLSVLPEGDQDALAAVAGEPLRPEIYHDLAELSFVQAGPRGLALHDVARGHLSTDLRWRTPARFRTLRRRAANLLKERMSAAQGPARHLLAAQLLELCADAMSVDCAVSAGLPYVSGLRAGDLPELHDIVTRSVSKGVEIWPLAAYHASLDAVAHSTPEAIRVARDVEGKPVAFTVQLALHRESVSLLHQALPGLLAFIPEDDLDALARTEVQDADTSLCITIALEASKAFFPSGEAVDLLMRDAWAGLSEGRRAFILLEGEGWKRVCRQLGCALHPLSSDQVEGVFFADLDLRQTDFGAWALSLLDRLEEGQQALPPRAEQAGPAPEEGASWGSRKGPAKDADLRGAGLRGVELRSAELRSADLAAGEPPAEEEVRHALSRLNVPESLKHSPLAVRLGIAPSDLCELLGQILTATPPPEPLDPEAQALLRATFLEPARNRSELAHRLYMSRSSYYRRLKEGVRATAEALVRYAGKSPGSTRDSGYP